MDLLEKLQGGDLRSTKIGKELAVELKADVGLLDRLLPYLEHGDKKVRFSVAEAIAGRLEGRPKSRRCPHFRPISARSSDPFGSSKVPRLSV